VEGLVKCRTCYGKRFIVCFAETILGNKRHVKTFCPNCEGTGTVFWIDEVMGRNRKRRKRHLKKLIKGEIK